MTHIDQGHDYLKHNKREGFENNNHDTATGKTDENLKQFEKLKFALNLLLGIYNEEQNAYSNTVKNYIKNSKATDLTSGRSWNTYFKNKTLPPSTRIIKANNNNAVYFEDLKNKTLYFVPECEMCNINLCSLIQIVSPEYIANSKKKTNFNCMLNPINIKMSLEDATKNELMGKKIISDDLYKTGQDILNQMKQLTRSNQIMNAFEPLIREKLKIDVINYQTILNKIKKFNKISDTEMQRKEDSLLLSHVNQYQYLFWTMIFAISLAVIIRISRK
jgi:hypothetical protein